MVGDKLSWEHSINRGCLCQLITQDLYVMQ